MLCCKRIWTQLFLFYRFFLIYQPNIYLKITLVDYNMSTKIKTTYNCDVCDRIWSRRYEYDRHLRSIKHEKMRLKSSECRTNSSECRKTVEKTPKKTILSTFCCDYCQFTCNTKKEAEKHRKSKQHIKNENKEEDFLEIVNRYTCVKCDKYYNIYASCWKHSKTCQGKPIEPTIVEQIHCSGSPLETQNVIFEVVDPNLTPASLMLLRKNEEELDVLRTSNNEGQSPKDGLRPSWVDSPTANLPELYEEVSIEMDGTISHKASITNDELAILKKEIYKEVCESVVGKILENNQIMMEKMSETMAQTQTLIQTKNTNNNTFIQNNNNITNNHCTINMFLNEKCKDAMNIFDFISNMNITFDHLYHQADHGFQKGLTNILLDNLKLLSVYNRPIHFTDIKREIMYIKDNDEWTKHEDKEKLVEALEWAAKQGVNCFVDWREATAAENEDLDSPTGQMWMKLMQTVVHPHDDRMKAYPKIVKEIARKVHLRKEDQT